MGLGLAFRCFFRALRDPDFGSRVQPLLTVQPEKPSGAEVALLGLLQRDGRLIDFLTEEIGAYSDDQIGAAVRDVHRDCHATLVKYVELEAVIDEPEDETVEVPEGFDPTSIRLTGSLTGSPPFSGTLAHRGWRVKAIHLPPSAEGADPLVLAPAEVEVT